MTVKEITQALGSWSVRLRRDTPKELLDALTYFGHIAILPGRVDPRQYGDRMLDEARYVGVYRARFNQGDEYEIKGAGMAFWLGDEDDKGDVFESTVTLSAATFANSIRALLPPSGAVIEGTLHAVAGTYTNKHKWETPRKAITYVTDTFGTEASPVEWRVNGDGSLDAGPISQLYTTTPKVMLVRKGIGADLARRAIAGQLSMDADAEDYSTRVVLLASGDGGSTATGSANGPATPYNDLHGNDVKLTRMVSESVTSAVNANARAQIALNRYLEERRAAQLSTSDYDVKGDLKVGDALDVYDPETGYLDSTREVYWQGVPINPVTLRCIELDWPIRAGWTVAFRDTSGAWFDLSNYYVPEGGDTRLMVGSFKARLAGGGSAESVGTRPVPDATVPATPVFGAFATTSYQPDAQSSETKAQIHVTWTQPLNVDGSTILDGSHYEIRYRPNLTLPYPATWAQVATKKWNQLLTWAQPLAAPASNAQWHTIYVGFDQQQHIIQELTPGVEYEFQIRAVDMASPPNASAWSATTPFVAARDMKAPATPAAPEVAASRIALQITHRLGISSGGTFNLDVDLDHLEVHVGGDPTFYADDSTRIGRLIANVGMISGQIPAVGTFNIEATSGVWVKVRAVDRTGNKSPASVAVQQTAQLIDDAHISDLTVSKVTAGSITAAWLLASVIRTAASGNRVEFASGGIWAYNPAGKPVFFLDSVTGDLAMYDPNGNEIFHLDADTGSLVLGGGTASHIELSIGAGVSDIIVDSGGTHYGRLVSLADIAQLSVYRSSDDAFDGGKALLGSDYGIISHQPDSGTESYFWFGNGGAGRIATQGLLVPIQSNVSLWHVGLQSTGAGFSGISIGYGFTMVTNPRVLYSLNGTPTLNENDKLTAENTTGFTASWTGTLAHGLRWLAYRS